MREWDDLRGHVPEDVFRRVQKKFGDQLAHAKEWRDVINTYFYRRTGIPDAKGRKIYEYSIKLQHTFRNFFSSIYVKTPPRL